MNNRDLNNEITKACKRIAPAWPLKNVVAVNPYAGLADLPFKKAATVLSSRGGINISMPITYYLNELKEGKIISEDIIEALKTNNKNISKEEFLHATYVLSEKSDEQKKYRLKTVVDFIEESTGKHWNDFMLEKISSWASAHYDEVQALWKTSDNSVELFESWKSESEIDRSTELMGIKNFRSILKALPDSANEASRFVLDKLQISETNSEQYLHTLLLKTVGWSSYIGGEDWNNALYEKGETNNLSSFLSILLCWEYCMLESFQSEEINAKWNTNITELTKSVSQTEPDKFLEAQLILQDAYDNACKRNLIAKFSAYSPENNPVKKPKAQAVFCIDVRSEVYRRNLENVDSEIETLGFAGFFGFSINYIPLTHSEGKNQCPVLIPSGVTVKETFSDQSVLEKARSTRLIKHQVAKTWKSFKAGAISSFSFVSPLGLSYLPKIISDSFGWTRPTEDPNKDGLSKWIKNEKDLDLSEISLEEKIAMAKGAITAMGLKDNMANLVLIVGHGSTSVNNPHATGYDCGACGGHTGEINAMTAERILNDKDVRAGLLDRGLEIKPDTHFIACLHDTTTDTVNLIGESSVPKQFAKELESIKVSLIEATKMARQERSLKFNMTGKDIDSSIVQRSKDWSQVRPEWGLAGCNSFIIAPRHKTTGIDLQGKSFLQSYDWKTDSNFQVLESIMTAPMLVTCWINLQYYASTVDNKRLGAGNKTLHNVSGGIGVLEGSSGDLRIGLPMQAVHDGKKYQHLPQRLNVVIDAPLEAINSIIYKHQNLKELVENDWITIFNLDENGNIEHNYKSYYIADVNDRVKKNEVNVEEVEMLIEY